MEAGYDYLLEDRRFRFLRRMRENPLPYAGGGLVVLGLIAVLVASLYFFVFNKSTAELEEELNASAAPAVAPVAPPASEPAQSIQVQQPVAPPAPAATPAPALALPPAPPVEVPPPPPAVVAIEPDDPPEEVDPPAGLYPGESQTAAQLVDPAAVDPADALAEFLESFQPISPETAASLGELPAPTRLLIPSIEVESEVSQLRLLNLGSSRSYETPDNVVGHIPESANPGEAGSTWLFGHLESPIRNEGNVFADLPEIPGMLRRGAEVFAVVENGNDSYLYRIVESKVVPQEELTLTNDGSPQLLMVTCVPRLVYDHRLVVRGELVGVKSIV